MRQPRRQQARPGAAHAGLRSRIWRDGRCPRAADLPAGPIFLRDRAAIAQALLERRIPSIAAFRENMEAGALISYGFDLMGLFYDIASHVHQIARGANPSDMPIEQSPRFYMAVNLKTAASLGVSLSDVFVARANEVRE
jgi:putative tryptophan/tyrosine transport system substrate-binding protein